MDAKKIMDQIITALKESNIDLTSVDPRARSGFEGRKRAAQDNLIKLQTEYKQHINENIVIIAVKGKYCKDFADIASNNLNFLSFNYMQVVDNIYNNVRKRGGQDFYSTNEHWMILDELNLVKTKYGILSLPAIQANFDDIGFNNPLRASIHHIFNRHYKGQLYTIVTKGDIGDKALEIQFKGQLLPVIVYNYLVDLDENILPKPEAILEISKKPTKASVQKTLAQIKENVKTKTSKNKGAKNE